MTAKPDDRSTLVDPRVAEAWRASAGEEPSASLDAAILAAARREVSAKPEPVDIREARAARRRWWPLAAAATVAAVAIGVLQVTPPEKLGAPAADTAIVSDVPAPAAKPAPVTAVPAPASNEEKPGRSDNASARSESPRTEEPRKTTPSAAPPVAQTITPQDATPVAPFAAPPAAGSVVPPEPKQQTSAAAPDPFPAAPKLAAEPVPAPSGQLAASPPLPAAAAAANASRERDTLRREAAAPALPVTEPADSRTAVRSPTPSEPLAKITAGRAADSGVDEARAKDRTALPVPEWIALIRRLRAEGKQAEAAKEIAAFRAAHPDHAKLLPPDLREWRPTDR